jgi:hypothetical protein
MSPKMCPFVEAKASAYQSEAGNLKREIFLRRRREAVSCRKRALDDGFPAFASVAVADQGDGFVAALRVDLLHDSVDMILDGEFGQIQICGDFLVAQAHGDE